MAREGEKWKGALEALRKEKSAAEAEAGERRDSLRSELSARLKKAEEEGARRAKALEESEKERRALEGKASALEKEKKGFQKEMAEAKREWGNEKERNAIALGKAEGGLKAEKEEKERLRRSLKEKDAEGRLQLRSPRPRGECVERHRGGGHVQTAR